MTVNEQRSTTCRLVVIYMTSALLFLAGCPYDQLAADITESDGGYYYGDPADGGIQLGSSAGAGAQSYNLTKAPSVNTLCKLVVGNYDGIKEMNHPQFLGTWIEDVESSIFFGKPAPNAEQVGDDAAQVSYHWPDGGIYLEFQWVQAWDKIPAKDGIASAWPRAFFLSKISIDGTIDGKPGYQDCWRGELAYPGAVPCPECQGSNDKIFECQPYPCSGKEIREHKGP